MVKCILAYHWSLVLNDVIFIGCIRCFFFATSLIIRSGLGSFFPQGEGVALSYHIALNLLGQLLNFSENSETIVLAFLTQLHL